MYETFGCSLPVDWGLDQGDLPAELVSRDATVGKPRPKMIVSGVLCGLAVGIIFMIIK